MAVKKILFAIAQQNQKAWRFTDQDMEDFSSDVGQTLRLMCRHLSLAMSKKTRPKWVVQIVGGSSQPCKANGDSGELGGEGEEEEEEEEEGGHCATVLKKLAAATASSGLLQKPAAAPVTFLLVMTQRTRLHGGLLVQLPRESIPRHSSLLRGQRTRIACLPVGLMAGSTRSQL